MPDRSALTATPPRTASIPGLDLPIAAEPHGSASQRPGAGAAHTSVVQDGLRVEQGATAHVRLLGLVHFTNDTYACILTALLPVLLPTLGLTVGAAGVLTALSQVVSAVVQPIIGYLSDRRRLHWPIAIGLILSAVGGSVVGLAPSFVVLAVCVVVASVGSSLFHPVAAATVGRLAPPDGRGRWMGLYETAGWGGTVVGPLLIGLTVEWTGPGWVWPAMLPALALAMVMLRRFPTGSIAPSAPETHRMEPVSTSSRLAGLGRLRFLGLFTTVGSVRAWAYYVVALLLPLLGHETGLGASGSAQLLTVFLAAGVLGSLICGAASDRLGARSIFIGALALTIPVGLMLGLVQPNGLGLFAVAAVSGFLLTGSYTALTVAGQEQLPGDAGMVTGLNVGLTSGIGGLAVVPLATLADDVGIRAALALTLTAGPLQASAIWLLLGRRR